MSQNSLRGRYWRADRESTPAAQLSTQRSWSRVPENDLCLLPKATTPSDRLPPDIQFLHILSVEFSSLREHAGRTGRRRCLAGCGSCKAGMVQRGRSQALVVRTICFLWPALRGHREGLRDLLPGQMTYPTPNLQSVVPFPSPPQSCRREDPTTGALLRPLSSLPGV